MNLETAFLGAITLRLLHDLPQDDAGWLIQALAEWILDDKLPDDDDIPTSCLGAWIAGKIGNAKRWNRNASQDVAEDRNASQDIASRAPAKTKTKTKTEIYTDDTADAVSSGAGDLRSAVSTSLSSADGVKERNYDAWAAMQSDPVDIALDITGEPPQKRRVYGARLKLLGRDRFVETCCTFRAEVSAGETVRNLGAALTKRLNDAITAKDEIGRIAQ